MAITNTIAHLSGLPIDVASIIDGYANKRTYEIDYICAKISDECPRNAIARYLARRCRIACHCTQPRHKELCRAYRTNKSQEMAFEYFCIVWRTTSIIKFTEHTEFGQRYIGTIAELKRLLD